ncbi:hypothetical protein Leryth_026874 [Lithospermum erythrorhizon]|nr:hypothetical protein Leryth_026874 [Lithospermum erythrorhizon]
MEETKEPKDDNLEKTSFPELRVSNISDPNSPFKELSILSQRTSKNIFRTKRAFLRENSSGFTSWNSAWDVACFAALVPNFTVGTPLIAGLRDPFPSSSGYFIVKHDIPKYWMFMHYFSLFKYPFEAFMVNEYGGRQRVWRCLKISDEGQCLMNADQFLNHQGLNESSRWNNIMKRAEFYISISFNGMGITFFQANG